MAHIHFKPESYQLAEDKKQTVKQTSFQKIDQLTSLIYLDNPNTIFHFGEHVAEELLKNADMVILSLSMKEFDEKTQLLSEVLKQMHQVSGTFCPLAKCLKDSVSSYRKTEKNLQKYSDADQILNQFFTQINHYVQEAENHFVLCERLFNDSVILYHDLIAHILAGRQGCKEIQQAVQETKDLTLLETYRKGIQLLQERVKQLSCIEQFAEKLIVSLKTILLKHYEFRNQQKHLIKVNTTVFRHLYMQTMFSMRQQAEKASDPDAYTAEGFSVHVEMLEAQWHIICTELKEIQWLKKGLRQEHDKNITDLKNLKQEFDANSA